MLLATGQEAFDLWQEASLTRYPMAGGAEVDCWIWVSRNFLAVSLLAAASLKRCGELQHLVQQEGFQIQQVMLTTSLVASGILLAGLTQSEVLRFQLPTVVNLAAWPSDTSLSCSVKVFATVFSGVWRVGTVFDGFSCWRWCESGECEAGIVTTLSSCSRE